MNEIRKKLATTFEEIDKEVKSANDSIEVLKTVSICIGTFLSNNYQTLDESQLNTVVDEISKVIKFLYKDTVQLNNERNVH